MKAKHTLHSPERYEIRVVGHLSANWAIRFEGLSIEHHPSGDTLLSGMLDQAALHGAIARIRDLGLKLISVRLTSEEKCERSGDFIGDTSC